MPNLIRKTNKYLINAIASQSIVPIDKHDAVTGRPLFIHTGLGICIPGNLASPSPVIMTVNVKPGGVGTAKVSTLELVKLRNVTELETEFFLTIKKKAKWNGFTDEVFDIDHSYNYLKKNFTTNSNGEFDSDDVADILSTMADRINADKNLGAAHVSTGAIVTALYVAASEVHGTYTGTPTGATTAVTITADEAGVAGNITLIHDDTSTIAELIAAWNLDNFGSAKTVTLIAGDGTQVPTADIVLAGGTAVVPAHITLTGKDSDTDFEVIVDTSVFSVDGTTTGIASKKVTRIPSKGRWDDIARIFPVKTEDAQTMPQMPIEDTYYAQIEIVQLSEGAANDVASGIIGKEQRWILYVPQTLVDDHEDYLPLALTHAALAANVTESWAD